MRTTGQIAIAIQPVNAITAEILDYFFRCIPLWRQNTEDTNLKNTPLTHYMNHSLDQLGSGALNKRCQVINTLTNIKCSQAPARQIITS